MPACIDVSSFTTIESNPALVIETLMARLESEPALRIPPWLQSDPVSFACTFLTENFLVRDLQIRRGMEGPQLILTWKAPKSGGCAEKLIIVRRKYDFPLSTSEPKIVYEGPVTDGFFVDLEVTPCVCYYYTVFTQLPGGDQLFGPVSQVAEFAIETGFFARKLFQLLPDLYVVSDKKQDELEISKLALSKVFDAEFKEYFALYEDGSVLRGQLQRFLRIVALELDIVKGLIDCLPTMFDVDETCCQFLELMAANIGLSINKDLNCTRQRKEVRNQVAIYKVKGTIQAVEARARESSGLVTRVQECCPSILITNRIDRTSVAWPNSGFSKTFKLPGDTTDYTPGGDYGFTCFNVFFLLECEDCVSEAIVKKLNRVLPPEYPVCRVGRLIFVDCTFVDEYDTEIEEIVCDTIEDAIADNVEDFRQHCWLITNRLGHNRTCTPRVDDERARVDCSRVETEVSGPAYGPSLFMFCEANMTNSLCAVTANPFRLCLELWYDEFEYTCVPRIDLARIDCSHVGGT